MATNERINNNYLNIGIETVDQAVYDWFDKIVDSHVMTPNEKLEKVNIVFASGERWVTGRDKRGIRDSKGLLILPLISIRRTSIEQKKYMHALGVEVPNLKIAKKVSGDTSKLQNAIDTRKESSRKKKDRVVYDVMTIPYPDFSVISYEIMIQAQYTLQMNQILEKIFDSFEYGKSIVARVLDDDFNAKADGELFEERRKFDGYYFVGFLDENVGDTGNFEEFTDSERIVRYVMNAKFPVYLHLDPSGKKPAVKIVRTSSEFDFSDENVCFVDDIEDLDKIFD